MYVACVYRTTAINSLRLCNTYMRKPTCSALVQLMAWHLFSTKQHPIRYCTKPSNDDVIKWKHFRRYWPFERGIHRWPVNPTHKDQWRGALMFSLMYVWTNSRGNNLDAGDLRRHRVNYDVTVMNWTNAGLFWAGTTEETTVLTVSKCNNYCSWKFLLINYTHYRLIYRDDIWQYRCWFR